jgi:hypothetical protein
LDAYIPFRAEAATLHQATADIAKTIASPTIATLFKSRERRRIIYLDSDSDPEKPVDENEEGRDEDVGGEGEIERGKDELMGWQEEKLSEVQDLRRLSMIEDCYFPIGESESDKSVEYFESLCGLPEVKKVDAAALVRGYGNRRSVHFASGICEQRIGLGRNYFTR